MSRRLQDNRSGAVCVERRVENRTPPQPERAAMSESSTEPTGHDAAHAPDDGARPAPQLQRPTPRRRRRLGRIGTWVVVSSLVAAAVGVTSGLSPAPSSVRCERAAEELPAGQAADICRREYAETRQPATGVKRAELLYYNEDLVPAGVLARQLLETPVYADALHVLGKVAAQQGQAELAIRHLEQARSLHRAAGNGHAAARDEQALAQVFDSQDKFSEALTAIDDCLVDARAADDARIEYYCHLAASQVLMRVGMFTLALHELEGAEPPGPRERFWREYQIGNVLQEVYRAPDMASRQATAVEHFKRALGFNTTVQIAGLTLSAHLNLAFSLAEIGRVDEAAQYLASAARLDADNSYAAQRTQLMARVAFRRNQLELAASANETAYAMTSDLDERIDIAVMQARIALAQGDLPRVADWARRGIEQV